MTKTKIAQDPEGFTTPKGRVVWIDDHENKVLGVRFTSKDVPENPPSVKLQDTETFGLYSNKVESWDALLDFILEAYSEGFGAGHSAGRDYVREGIEEVLGVTFDVN